MFAELCKEMRISTTSTYKYIDELKPTFLIFYYSIKGCSFYVLFLSNPFLPITVLTLIQSCHLSKLTSFVTSVLSLMFNFFLYVKTEKKICIQVFIFTFSPLHVQKGISLHFVFNIISPWNTKWICSWSQKDKWLCKMWRNKYTKHL